VQGYSLTQYKLEVVVGEGGSLTSGTIEIWMACNNDAVSSSSNSARVLGKVMRLRRRPSY
jgi:hypothetical protein